VKNNLNTILKAALATLFYIIGIELLGSWVFLAEFIGFNDYHKYYALIQGIVQLAAVLIFIYFVSNRTFRGLIKRTDYKWYLFGLLLGISFVFMQTPLKWLYNLLFETEYKIAYRFDGLPKFKNINLVFVTLLIPIGEELFFRKYIQDNLQKKMNTFVAVLIAAIMFAFIHSPYMNLIFEFSNLDLSNFEYLKKNWHLFYLTLFGGIISGTLYYKSKSIIPSIIFHLFWNITSTIV